MPRYLGHDAKGKDFGEEGSKKEQRQKESMVHLLLAGVTNIPVANSTKKSRLGPLLITPDSIGNLTEKGFPGLKCL